MGKEEKASQLWRKHLPWRSWSWRTRPRRGGAVLLAHRPGVHLQQWQEAEASTWRGPAWNKVLWRSLWWHPSLWQLLLQQPDLPGPEREHPRGVPAQRQHGEDVVLHHRV